MSTHRPRPGFTIVELMLVIIAIALLIGMTLPALARFRTISNIDVSLNNLNTLGIAHVMYAADHDDRQITYLVDDIAGYGSGGSLQDALDNFASENGYEHPGIWLGWAPFGDGAARISYDVDSTGWVYAPMHFNARFGSFRFPHARPFHDYVGGRVYDPTFFAPNDNTPYSVVEPLFDEPWETFYIVEGLQRGITGYSSYCTSPAAFYHPDVLRHTLDGGYQNPGSLVHGYNVPRLSHAAYPNLKTMMLEHHWNQNVAAECNPAWDPGTWRECEPYYFNHALASEPATLFYDLSTRLLPNTEVLAADEYLIDETGYGLWSRDTPHGSSGYFSFYGYDLFDLSHHVLTTDGILGRDTLAGFEGQPVTKIRAAEGARHPDHHVISSAARPTAPGSNATISVE